MLPTMLLTKNADRQVDNVKLQKVQLCFHIISIQIIVIIVSLA